MIDQFTVMKKLLNGQVLINAMIDGENGYYFVLKDSEYKDMSIGSTEQFEQEIERRCIEWKEKTT